MLQLILFASFLLLASVSSSYDPSALEFPLTEYTALYDLYNATNGVRWNWKKPYAINGNPWSFPTQTNPCTDSWQGIICSVDAGAFHVAQLFLPAYGLHGTIPNTISNLTELQVLDLVQNHLLVGTIPSSIGYLSNLQRLELVDNNLRGTIPSSFLQLSNLLSIQVDTNKLDGTLPDFLCGLPQLESFTATSNHFFGTIPECFGNLNRLQVLSLDGNFLHGTIPNSFGNLTQLARLTMQNMQLSGTIPASIGNMSQLQWIYLSYNNLTGTIPDTLYNLTNLMSIGLTDNKLSGTISERIARLTQLQTITLEVNHLTGPLLDSLFSIETLLEVTMNNNGFTGSIPDIIGNLPALDNLDLSFNILNGTLPVSLWNMTTLAKLIVSNNELSGTLPSYVTPNNIFNYIELSNNRFSGTIPGSVVESFAQLYVLELGGNRFVGPIPSSLGSLRVLEELDLSYNSLTGTVPSSFQYLSQLNSLLLQGNQLRGTLYTMVSPSQTLLTSIQLDYNQFTGELPAQLFQLPALMSLSIVGSCLHGTLPTNICNATNLEALILQGLTTGASCRQASLSFQQHKYFGGTIPSCLLSMRKLGTLLLSSNGLNGKINLENNTISRPLVQLDLSHNLLTGSIPVTLQNHTWTLLDLSHNKLSGTLNKQLRAPHLTYVADINNNNFTGRNIIFYPKLALNTNRLSGMVPNTVKQLQSNLSVLAGNLFQCRYDKTDLPQHDSDIDTYECASNSFDLSIYLWIGVVLVCTSLLYVYLRFYRVSYVIPYLEHSKLWTVKLPNMLILFKANSYILKAVIYTTLFCLVVLLPYYAILSRYSGTHTYQYAYVLSAIYTSGVIPFTLTFLLLAILMYMIWWLLANATDDRPAISGAEYTNLPSNNQRYLSVCIVYALTNICIVLGVNILFVYIVLYQSSEVQTVAQVALSLFKLVWSVEVSPYMMRRLDAYCHSADGPEEEKHRQNYFTLQLLVALFNNIAIPCLVVMAIDPNCFSAVLLPPNPEAVNYAAASCERNLYRSACSRQSYRITSTEYTPPFTYSYQCSASFITSYAPAFIYMSISNAILHPLLQYTLMRIYTKAQTGGVYHTLVLQVLPRLLQAPSVESLQLLQGQNRKLIGATGALVALFTQLGILLSFGAIFPPVALAMAVSIGAAVYLIRFKVQRFVQAAIDAQLLGYLDVINAECAGVGTRDQMQLAVKIIVCYCCAFYTLFLFDALGDAEGFAASVWVLIVIPVAPVFVFGLTHVVALSHKGKVPLLDVNCEVELGNIADAKEQGQQDGVVVVSVLHE